MPKLNVDASKAMVFGAVPAGQYPCQILEVSDEIKGPRARYVKFTFAVSEGEHEGRKFWRNAPIEGEGAGIFLEIYNAALRTNYTPADFGEVEVDTDDLIGQEVIVVVTEREHPEGSGIMTNDVARVLPTST